MNIKTFLSRLPDSSKLKKTGTGWLCRCPAHQPDNDPSLSITEGKEGRILVKCFTGCTAEAICAAMGLTLKDLMPDKSEPPPFSGNGPPPKTVVATYSYADESGAVLYQKLRYEPKTFRIRRPDTAREGEWLWGLNATRKILYRLPELITAVKDERPVFIVEGEKDVDILYKNGFSATCNPMGASEDWMPQYSEPLRNSESIVIADKDDAGRLHAKTVKTALETAARSVRYLELPDRNGFKVKDTADWFEAGGTSAELDQIIHTPEPIDPNDVHWSMKELAAFDTQTDQNAVIGWHDGHATRYLCKGYPAWLISQSGIGKSVLTIQQGCLWSLNKPFAGIYPAKTPLRILIVQNENDIGDCAEAFQGILDGAQFTTAEFDMLNERIKIVRCRGKTGKDFCKWLEHQILAWKADICYVDPLLRFAGIDVSRQDQVTRFLNESLDPVLAKTDAVMMGIHHTGKPRSKKETQGWSIYDHAYAGIGSSELVNWARAVSIIQVTGQGTFEMLLAKRGSRAWATHPNSPDESTNSIFLKHAQGRIYWEQTDPPEIQTEPKSNQKGGRPNKITEIACSNLHAFCAACIPEGESKNAIARRLEQYLATNRIDVSFSTCKSTIEALVANQKLTKNSESLYLKGPQA